MKIRPSLFPRSIFEAITGPSAVFIEPTEPTDGLEITVASMSEERTISTNITIEEAVLLRRALSRWLRQRNGADTDGE
ncbi:MAG: hypothetical protein QOI24_1057 [Acidobacteriota bacterium]|nr:hypothetical protein [Acidobacteriota bacterium]